MNQTRPTALIAALLACGAMPAVADTQIGEYLSFSGFGTLAAVQTNNDESKLGRDRQFRGADTNASFDVDSNLGLQLTGTANKWLSGTVQVLTVKRQLEDHLTTEAEWGFVKVKPIEGLSLRAGRMAVPMFQISDSLNVGYANNWLRAPNEVYGLVSFRRLQGIDATYQFSLGSNSLTINALMGSSQLKYIRADGSPPQATLFRMKSVRGLNAQLETEWATFRLGRVNAQYDNGAAPHYSFTDFGVVVDRNNLVMQAEYVQKRAPTVAFAEADGWYVMGGYRFGAWLPYASLASSKPKTVAANNTSGEQKTVALGVRWEAFKSAALKFQLDRIDTNGTKGVSFIKPVSKPVTAASVGIDFVF